MHINATLLAEVIVFAIFVWFAMKFVWPPITQAMGDREKRIADGLASAERGEHELELAKKKASSIITEGRQEAATVIEQANRRSNEMIEEAKETAKEEAERVHAQERAQLEHEVNQARAEMRRQLTELSITAASRILEREIDPKAHEAMLEELARQI